MDPSNAFDIHNHDILFKKLKHYGLANCALNLLKSYLSNRKQFVYHEGFSSSNLDITTGVPQGSILGPLVFIIYIHDIVNVSKKLKPIMYADDTTLTYSPSEHHESLEL